MLSKNLGCIKCEANQKQHCKQAGSLISAEARNKFTIVTKSIILVKICNKYVCSTCHTIFGLKKTFECVGERLLQSRLIVAIT